MKRNVSHRRLLFAAVAAAVVRLYLMGVPIDASELRIGEQAQSQPVDNCVACHQKQSDEAVSLFPSSTHGRTRKTCASCHGGVASAADKVAAHGGRFIGQASSNQVLTMCGSCHAGVLASFKTSRHFPEKRDVPRVDCVRCHGAHAIGSPSHAVSFAYYCTGCHGLEYLPRLPEELQRTLSMSDDLGDQIRAAQSAGRSLSPEESGRRRELRRAIADLVHRTDTQGAVQKAATIQEQIRALSKSVASKQ